MDRAECAYCEREADFSAFCTTVQEQIKDITGQDEDAPAESSPVVCDYCGHGALKPAIVLFRSSLPRLFFERLPTDLEGIDLLLVMGTSLQVAPANSIVWRVPKSAMRVLVNRESAGEHLGMNFDPDTSKRDYFAQGDIDEVVLELMHHLGWVNELEDLLPDRLPASSAALLRARLAGDDATANDISSDGAVAQEETAKTSGTDKQEEMALPDAVVGKGEKQPEKT